MTKVLGFKITGYSFGKRISSIFIGCNIPTNRLVGVGMVSKILSTYY